MQRRHLLSSKPSRPQEEMLSFEVQESLTVSAVSYCHSATVSGSRMNRNDVGMTSADSRTRRSSLYSRDIFLGRQKQAGQK